MGKDPLQCGNTKGEDVRSTSRSAGILGSLIATALGVFWVWGIGWSFYRHGAWDGAMALTIPPYAWYRGVAAIWEEPEWKTDWNEKVQVVGILLQGAGANLSPSDQIDFLKMQSREKKWIGKLPRAQRDRLFVESEAV